MGSLPTELSCEPLPAKPSEEGKLREQFDRVAVLDQRVSPRAGQDKSEHSLRCAGSEGRDPPSPAEAKQCNVNLPGGERM